MGEYTYEFCFFGRATQKPNRGHGNVSLGSFSRFAPKNATIGYEQDAYFLRAIYDAGQRCWNGPDRSLIVSLQGGTDTSTTDPCWTGRPVLWDGKRAAGCV